MKKLSLLVVALAFLAGCANNTVAPATDVSGNATVTANVTANVK